MSYFDPWVDGLDAGAWTALQQAVSTRIQRERPPAVVPSPEGSKHPAPTPEEIQMREEGRTIDAIRAYRQRTGYGLLDSKNVIAAIPLSMSAVAARNARWSSQSISGRQYVSPMGTFTPAPPSKQSKQYSPDRLLQSVQHESFVKILSVLEREYSYEDD